MIKYNIIFLCILTSLCFVACKKDKSVLGSNVQPAEDGLSSSFIDNMDVFCYTKKYDSIACYNSRYKFLGHNLDPYFGEVNVGMYLNANLNVSNWDFGTRAKIVSSEIIFAVDFLDFAGDTSALLNYSVFPLNTELNKTLVYLSNNESLHNKTPISTASLKFSLLNGKPVLRIPIDTSYSGPLMRNKNYLVNNETFLAQYKGFYIKTAVSPNSQGTIFKCDLEDETSGFYIRYNVDTLESFKFAFKGSASVKHNTISYTYTNAHPSLKSQLAGDSAAGTSNLFLKGLGVSKLRLYIPNLKNLSDSFGIAVNRAELLLYPDFTNFMQGKISNAIRYNIPTKLSLITCDSVGREKYVIDQINPIDAGRYDGGYDDVRKCYVFNIPRHAQSILNGKTKNYGFYVVVANPESRFTVFRDTYIDRVVLAGSANNDLRPRFNLSYIKFKNP